MFDTNLIFFINCHICNKIAYYKLDDSGNVPEKYNECDECKSLDESSRRMKKVYKELKEEESREKAYLEYLDNLYLNLHKDFQSLSNKLKTILSKKLNLRETKILDNCKQHKKRIDIKYLEIINEKSNLKKTNLKKTNKIEIKIKNLRVSIREINKKLLRIKF